MPEKASLRVAKSQLDKLTKRELLALLTAIIDGNRAIAAKLDGDATVTGTDYAATFDTFVTKT